MLRRLLPPAILGALALPTPALAQAAPPTNPPVVPPARADVSVTPPAVQGSTDVPYPAGGQGDATVLLDVVIDRDGRGQ